VSPPAYSSDYVGSSPLKKDTRSMLDLSRHRSGGMPGKRKGVKTGEPEQGGDRGGTTGARHCRWGERGLD